MTAAATMDVCVIIAAKNAAETIGRAVASALAEPETAEVIVIDDGSTDATASAALTAADDSGRLNVVRFESNRGPAAARNHAIAVSRSPILAILDADDFFLPGRLAELLAVRDWDFVADNIAFMDDAVAAVDVDRFEPQPRLLDLTGFVEGNISHRGVRRGEIGFLKPLMRREFLSAHQLAYNETLRLGEDYDLYLRALAKGARYKIIHSCGYAAIVRGNSLSGSHRTEDLKRLYEADRVILEDNALSTGAAAVIRRHERHIRGRYEHRRFLDLKREGGPIAAITYLLGKPAAFPAVAGGIFADKTERMRANGPPSHAGRDEERARLRYLLPASAEQS